MPTSAVLEAIAVTAELCGRTFSPAAAAVFAADLDGYPEPAVLAALSRCRKEVKGVLSLQDVISRLDDGRPSADEAWALLPFDEETTVVWTEEMCQAWGVALPLVNEGDRVAARMAFKDSYQRSVSEARDQRKPAKWSASIGHDKQARDAVLLSAVQKGRLPAPHVKALLANQQVTPALQSILNKVELKLVSNQ